MTIEVRFGLHRGVIPLVGDYRDKIGYVREIIIGLSGTQYGIADLPNTFKKILYYKEEELKAV